VTAVSIATSPTTTGYRILRSDGGVDGFSAIRYGSLLRKLHGRSRPVAITDASG
jgi:hypothetical protein